MTTDATRYGFGDNWSNFIQKNFSEERVQASREKLLAFLKLDSLDGMSFLDIGCGSGLHSLAALRSGAKNVVSFDYDINSVNTAKLLWEREGKPAHWRIEQGSVLDRDYMAGLPVCDIVYSWGVLHHTGEVWTAIRNAALPVGPKSLFFIALYSYDIQIDPPAEFWLDVKRRYNAKGSLGRFMMEFWYFWNFIYKPDRAAGRSTIKRFREYYKSRGMSQWTDIRDWLGGWPMEFVKIAEVQRFAADQLDLELLGMTSNEANAEYLFRKKGSEVWGNVLKKRIAQPLAGPFKHSGGMQWEAPLPGLRELADTPEHPRRSPLFVLEDDLRLQIPHGHHPLIRGKGLGRYSHWEDKLLFSTSDNTDPNTNGRAYSIAYDPE